MYEPVVNIVPHRVERFSDDQYDSLVWDYDPNHCRVLFRTNECWKLFAGNTHDDLMGGPLVGRHRLYEIHAHWGRKFPEFCREHTVNQQAYAGELHLLHTNIERCLQPSSAGKYPDPGIRAVISIFLKEGRKHDELAKITDLLQEICRPRKVVEKKEFHSMADDVDPALLFPENLEYWTYDETRGTTDYDSWVMCDDPYDTEDMREKVTYMVFKTPIEVSKEQLLIMYPPYMRGEGGEREGRAPLSTRSIIREGIACPPSTTTSPPQQL